MPNGTGLDRFQPKHPDRYFDVGIAEEHAVLFAAGMATKGFKPFCAIYSTFLQRAYDQIIHDVCLQNLPVVGAAHALGVALEVPAKTLALLQPGPPAAAARGFERVAAVIQARLELLLLAATLAQAGPLLLPQG